MSCDGYPEDLSCNDLITVHYCGTAYPDIAVFDQIGACNSGPTYGCNGGTTRDSVLDLVDATFVAVGGNLDDGPISITVTF
jgi:hypothetical protein